MPGAIQAPVQAPQQMVQARVVSSAPVTLPNGSIAYNVTYSNQTSYENSTSTYGNYTYTVTP